MRLGCNALMKTSCEGTGILALKRNLVHDYFWPSTNLSADKKTG